MKLEGAPKAIVSSPCSTQEYNFEKKKSEMIREMPLDDWVKWFCHHKRMEEEVCSIHTNRKGATIITLQIQTQVADIYVYSPDRKPSPLFF